MAVGEEGSCIRQGENKDFLAVCHEAARQAMLVRNLADHDARSADGRGNKEIVRVRHDRQRGAALDVVVAHRPRSPGRQIIGREAAVVQAGEGARRVRQGCGDAIGPLEVCHGFRASHLGVADNLVPVVDAGRLAHNLVGQIDRSETIGFGGCRGSECQTSGHDEARRHEADGADHGGSPRN